jgi:hypothetical protein
MVGGLCELYHGYRDMRGELRDAGSSCHKLVEGGSEVLEEVAEFL